MTCSCPTGLKYEQLREVDGTACATVDNGRWVCNTYVNALRVAERDYLKRLPACEKCGAKHEPMNCTPREFRKEYTLKQYIKHAKRFGVELVYETAKDDLGYAELAQLARELVRIDTERYKAEKAARIIKKIEPIWVSPVSS